MSGPLSAPTAGPAGAPRAEADAGVILVTQSSEGAPYELEPVVISLEVPAELFKANVGGAG